MVTATSEYEGAYERLRGQLIASARRRHVHVNDLEDVVHDALEKMLREHVRPGAPSLKVRSFTALRDKQVEHFRREVRRSERVTSLTLPADEEGHVQERAEVASIDAAFQLFELRATIEAIAGTDAMRFAFLSVFGATENDIAILLQWPATRAAAARVQFGRKKAHIARAIIDTLD